MTFKKSCSSFYTSPFTRTLCQKTSNQSLWREKSAAFGGRWVRSHMFDLLKCLLKDSQMGECLNRVWEFPRVCCVEAVLPFAVIGLPKVMPGDFVFKRAINWKHWKPLLIFDTYLNTLTENLRGVRFTPWPCSVSVAAVDTLRLYTALNITPVSLIHWPKINIWARVQRYMGKKK